MTHNKSLHRQVFQGNHLHYCRYHAQNIQNKDTKETKYVYTENQSYQEESSPSWEKIAKTQYKQSLTNSCDLFPVIHHTIIIIQVWSVWWVFSSLFPSHFNLLCLEQSYFHLKAKIKAHFHCRVHHICHKDNVAHK